MSLNFDLTKIENYEELCWTPNPEKDGEFFLNPKTEAIVFATMVVDIGNLTESSAKEFYIRCVLAQRIFNYSTPEQPSWSGITTEDINAHIGLTTNVTFLSRTKWIKKTLENAITEISRDWNRKVINV